MTGSRPSTSAHRPIIAQRSHAHCMDHERDARTDMACRRSIHKQAGKRRLQHPHFVRHSARPIRIPMTQLRWTAAGPKGGLPDYPLRRSKEPGCSRLFADSAAPGMRPPAGPSAHSPATNRSDAATEALNRRLLRGDVRSCLCRRSQRTGAKAGWRTSADGRPRPLAECHTGPMELFG